MTDESTCVARLEKVRWGGEPACPRCGHLRCYRIRTRAIYSCARCRRSFTVRHGTIFEDSKFPLPLWFAAMSLVTSSRTGVNSLNLAEMLGISQLSAWYVLHRLEFACLPPS